MTTLLLNIVAISLGVFIADLLTAGFRFIMVYYSYKRALSTLKKAQTSQVDLSNSLDATDLNQLLTQFDKSHVN